MNLKDVQAIDRQHHLPAYNRTPLLISGGQGAHLVSDEGRTYIDFVAGIAVNALGYGREDVKAAVQEALEFPLHTSNLFHHPFQAPLARSLCRLSGLPRIFFTNSGTEAVEAAMKLARLHARRRGEESRTGFVAFEGGFHGRTMGSLSVTARAKYREPFQPLVPGAQHIPLNDTQRLETAVGAGTAAVILETIQGEGGIREAEPQFLRRLREICDRRGALWIADEVQCGLGRTGQMFAFQRSGVLPDLLCLAKPLGLGVPLGALLAREEFAATLRPGEHGSTFGGNPVACRLARLLVERLEDDLLQHVQDVGKHFRDRLQQLTAHHACVQEIRGRGLMLGMVLENGAEWLVADAFEHGFLLNRTAEQVIRLVPPLTITVADIDALLEYLEDALARVPA